ncbi:MAG: hypothetical protein AAGJ73_00055 [Pseudomonadota bacterium]
MTDKLAQTPELRVSIAVGAAFVIQTACAFIWAGAAAERIDQLERRMDASQELIERTARLEEQVVAVRATLTRIERKIDNTRREPME